MVAINFHWEVPWSCKELCAYIWTAGQIQTICIPCTHSTCDSNSASLGHLSKSGKFFPRFIDSQLQTAAWLAHFMLTVRSMSARIKAIFISGMSPWVHESVSPVRIFTLGPPELWQVLSPSSMGALKWRFTFKVYITIKWKAHPAAYTVPFGSDFLARKLGTYDRVVCVLCASMIKKDLNIPSPSTYMYTCTMTCRWMSTMCRLKR